MAHKRSEFTETQKADIYARDRATCAFSVISLWLPDYGIRPNWQMDWVDHIRPSAAGGKADLNNGVCASHTFNAKKRNNSSDNILFVKEGRLTEDFVWVFGNPPKKLLTQLARLKDLEPADWYFNRCIANTFTAFDWRCNLEFDGIKYKRDDTYWFKAAWKRLQTYDRKRPKQDIKERGLLIDPLPHGTPEIIAAEFLDTQKGFVDWAENIFPLYRASYNVLHRYKETKDFSARKTLLDNAERENKSHPEVIQALSAHLDCWRTDPPRDEPGLKHTYD